jgi:hypothetical protein
MNRDVFTVTKLIKTSNSGLTRGKKDILKSLIGSTSSDKIDLNKRLDEERYCTTEESLIESIRGEKTKNK